MAEHLKQEVRIGLVGAGNIAKQHIRNLSDGSIPNAVLRATLSRSPEPACEGVRHYSSLDQFLSSAGIDAVIVATPTYTHQEIGLAVLNSGLHLMMEKPLGRSAAEARSLITAASNKQIFAVMLNQRLHPAYARIKSILESGDLGNIQRVSWTMTKWYRPDIYYQVSEWRGTWRGEGGGVLINQSIHNIDVLQWLTGVPDHITAFAKFGKYHEIEVEDEVTAYLEYPNGSTGVFVTSTGESPGINQLDIVGEIGSLHYDGDNLSMRTCSQRVSDHCRTTRDMFGAPAFATESVAIDPPVDQHALMVRNFADAIAGKAPLISPAREGLASLEIVNAALWSSWNGKRVNVPVDSEEYARALRERIDASGFRKPVGVKASIDMEKSFR